jgi:ketosteroid isomerase-like protein
MSTQDVGALLQQYFEVLLARGDYARFFADDIALTLNGADERHGPSEAERAIRYMHQVAFDARPEPKGLIVSESSAAVEAEFVGRHVAEFAGVPPTGRSVRVPYSVFYDVADGKITSLRIYMPMDVLVSQIAAPAAATTAR